MDHMRSANKQPKLPSICKQETKRSNWQCRHNQIVLPLASGCSGTVNLKVSFLVKTIFEELTQVMQVVKMAINDDS